MVRWTRSARIAPGKFMEAIRWAKEIAEYTNKKYGSQVTVYLDSAHPGMGNGLIR